MDQTASLEDRLIGGIYAALFKTRRWEDVLDEATGLLPNGKATLLYHDTRRGIGNLSIAARFPQASLRDYAAHYGRINPWMPHAAQRPIGLASSTREMMPNRDLLRTEFHTDFLRNLDVQQGIGITLAQQGQYHFYLSVLGADCNDEDLFQQCRMMERIAPHLRYAFTLARSAPDPSDDFAEGIGRIVLGVGGTLRRANAAARVILAEGDALRLGPGGVLQHRNPMLDAQIAAACSAWSLPQAATTASRVLLRRGLDRMPLSVTVLRPSRTIAEAFFHGPEAVLILDDPERNRPAVASFADFYGLTPAEIRTYQALVDGLSPMEIAKRGLVSVETVRSHLKSLFRKTDRRSQAELVTLAHQLGRSIFR